MACKLVFSQMTNGCGAGDLRFLACVEEQCTEVKGHSCLVADVAVSCDSVRVWEQRTGEQHAWARWKVLGELVLELARGRAAAEAGSRLGRGGPKSWLQFSSRASEAMEQELTRNRWFAEGAAAGA